MSVHTLSVCPGDQHSFWFTGGIFEESSPDEGTPLLQGLPVSSPSRPDLVMHRVDAVDIWFLGQLSGYAGRFSISGEQTLMPIPKN